MRNPFVRWIAAVILAAGAVAGPVVYRQTTGDEAETANIWVDLDGGTSTCQDSASLVEYTEVADANSCTWDEANDTCEAGDTVIVKGGSYGDVALTGSNSRAADCLISTADGETVTLDEFEWDTGTAVARIYLTGPLTTRNAYVDLSSNVTFDNVTVDGNFQTGGAFDAQILHIEDVTNFTFKNGEVKNGCAITGYGGMIAMLGTGGVTLDNNEIHDAHNCDPAPGDPHTECGWFSGIDNVTFTRNRVYRCATMGIFITGDNGDGEADNLFFENNYFGRPCSDNASPHVCETPHASPAGLHFRTDGVNGASTPSPCDSDIRHNTFRGDLSIDNGDNQPCAAGLRIHGNAFVGGAPCGLSNTTYSYNAHVSGSCGGTGSFNDAGLGSDFAATDDFAADGGNWYPVSGGAQVNVGNTADYPALDLLGVSRYDGSAPDIGAYEYQE